MSSAPGEVCLAHGTRKCHVDRVNVDRPLHFELSCLGAPAARVCGEAAPREVLWRTHFALLAYLALSPNFTRARGHLLGVLWAEKPNDNARRSLNEAVRRLRAVLGEQRLLSHGESLVLNAESLSVDVVDFESGCGRGDLRALDLWRGEFLEGFHVEDAPEFDAWMEEQRARLRHMAAEVLVRRAEEQLAVNRCVEARTLALRALAIDRHREPAVSLAMRSAALDGDVAGSLALFHEFAAVLERELGEGPSPPLRALASRIRSGYWQAPGRAGVNCEPPLVGRRHVHARLFTALESVGSARRCGMVITGDASSGRTRLLDECFRRLALSGAVVATARLLESDHDAPWSTLRTLMRGGLADAPGVAGTDHYGLRALAAIVPEIASRVPPLDTPDAAQLADGLTSLLTAVGEERIPALLIDDAQWADRPTLALLDAVWRRSGRAPLVLAITVQSGAPLSPECRSLVATIGREAASLQLHLDPLTTDDILALVEALAPWCARPEDRARLARRVESEAGGNPFLAVTLLRDLGATANGNRPFLEPGATQDAPLPITIPAAVRAAIAARVARLDEDSLAVLRSAGVAGEVLEPPLLSEVLQLPRTRIDAAIERLERERLVLFDGARYVFQGRLVPAVIERECIQPGGRRRLRQLYAEVLASRHDLESQFLRARLLAAEDQAEAFDVALRVVERATELKATRTASAALRVAESAAANNATKLARLSAVRAQMLAADGG